ncbi:MAG TPA: hypothetical protein VLJ37_02205 [bacterium]|nr:hypothetical protein [bacterium]
MILAGRGFSYVAPENIVSVGGVTQAADAYDVAEDGTESLTFLMPDDAAEGETAIIVVTEGRTSNALPFTVLPLP